MALLSEQLNEPCMPHRSNYSVDVANKENFGYIPILYSLLLDQHVHL
jgi:hypothetical protein